MGVPDPQEQRLQASIVSEEDTRGGGGGSKKKRTLFCANND